ncbi:MAG: excisionase family DNA-binding protein [Candidatus Desulfatibia sp.]
MCAYLGSSRETVYKWIDTKKLPAYRFGSLWKFKKEQVDEGVKKSAR